VAERQVNECECSYNLEKKKRPPRKAAATRNRYKVRCEELGEWDGIAAGFPFLAKATNGFAETNGEGGDGLDALLTAFGEAIVTLAANFGEEEFGVAKNSGERIVQFVAKDFAKIFAAGVEGAGRAVGENLGLAKALFDEVESNRETCAGALDIVRGTGSDQSGERWLMFCAANDNYGSVGGEGRDGIVEAASFFVRGIRARGHGGFFKKNDGGRSFFQDESGGFDVADGRDADSLLESLQSQARGSAESRVVAY
jgi:hypothetical protein